MRRALLAGIGILVLTMCGAAIAIWYVSTGRLAERARAALVVQVERATGARAEIGRFRFQWRTLTAEIDNAELHGTEPAGTAPLFSADRILVRLRIASLLERRIDLVSAELDHPSTHIIVAADGSTNLPHPPARGRSRLDGILDLRIGSFDARNGVFISEVNGHSASQPWSAHGRNLLARFHYDASGPRYAGVISVAPLEIAAQNLGSMDLDASARVSIERDRIRLVSADLRTSRSELRLSDLTVRNFQAPVITSHYQARLAPAEFAGDLRRYGVRAASNSTVESEGEIRFLSPGDYSVTGEATAAGFDFGPFHDLHLAARLDAAPDRILLSNARARLREGEVLAGAEIRNLREFRTNGRLEHFDGRRLIAVAARENSPYDASLSGPFEASGDLGALREGRFTANARLTAAPVKCEPRAADTACVPVRGDIHAKYNGFARTIELSESSLSLPSTRIDVSGVIGRELNVNLETRDLADFQPVIGKAPYLELRGGRGTFRGAVSGPLFDPAIRGHLALENALVNGEKVDLVSGDFAARKTDFSIGSALLSRGPLKARLAGSVALANWRPSDNSAVDVTADANGAEIRTLLAMAGERDLEFSGSGAASAHITGTLGEPQITAHIALAHGSLFGQPYDAIDARVEFPGRGVQLFNASFVSGAERITAGGRFDRAPGASPFTGTLSFNAQSNAIALNRIALVRVRRPAIHGTAQFHMRGAARIRRDAKGNLALDLLSINGDASANSLELEGRNLGDSRLTAETNGDVITARFDSNAAKASIHGGATVRLERDYPMSASVTFSRAGLNALAVLIAAPQQAEHFDFDGVAAGEAMLSGPALDWKRWSGSISVPEIEIYPLEAANCGADAACASIRNFRLRNSGTVRLTFANGMAAVESARFTGPRTDVSLSGTLGLAERAGYNLRAAGDVNLALASTFTTDFTATGVLHIDAALRGALDKPDLSGRMDIRNGSMHYAGFANGITNVNAQLAFTANRATIQSFTGESGGGRVNVGGFAALTGGLIAYRLDVRTTGVRMRFAEGLSIVSDSQITVAGTSERSEASGTVVIHRVAVSPRADFSSIFARSVEPAKAITVQAGPLSNLNLDVQIETAQDVALETSLAQRIEADASLRLRGTATNPALLGRINITSGELMFFGNKYAITTGSISFLNPARIDPFLNVDLETRARGVDVILTIAGPLTKPSVSYRSDPPLQFSDIVALLATGRSPYDPGLPSGAVGQQQAFAQLGASQLVGEAIQNPASSRLQRFFGVSKVKIDPQLTDVTGSPESRLTVEQQVTPDILFTYITDVSSTSTQLIRVEWAFNRHWSAILTREENGYVGLDFAYRKRFK